MSGSYWAHDERLGRASGMGGFGGGSFGLDDLSASCPFPTDGSELNFGEPFDEGYLGDRLTSDSEDLFAESEEMMAGEKAEFAKDMLFKESDSDLLLALNEVDVSGPMERLEDFGVSAAYDFKSRLDGFAYNMPASKPMGGSAVRGREDSHIGWADTWADGYRMRDPYGYYAPDPTWLLRMFPELPPTPTASQTLPSDWPDEARRWPPACCAPIDWRRLRAVC
jgi:hypothetical protein